MLSSPLELRRRSFGNLFLPPDVFDVELRRRSFGNLFLLPDVLDVAEEPLRGPPLVPELLRGAVPDDRLGAVPDARRGAAPGGAPPPLYAILF